MAEAAELDTRIARLEAALDAAEAALRTSRETSAQKGPEMPTVSAELEAAQGRIEELEVALADVRKRAEATPSSSGSGEAATLRAELAELREARAMDLAEMKALLAELEPMLESADA